MNESIKSSWTYNHVQLIIILVLIVVIGVQEYNIRIAPVLEHSIEYIAPCDEIECIIEARADILFRQNEMLYREMARTEAMQEAGDKVIRMMMQ